MGSRQRALARRRSRGAIVGEIGTLEGETSDGRRFFIGSGLRDVARRTGPPIGSTITYRYRDLASGCRAARPLRRHDDW